MPLDSGAEFVGRRREHDAVVAQLRASAAAGAPALVVLTGPGGVGKTRLARRIASELGADFPGGSRVVELVAVATEATVADVVLAAVGGERSRGCGVLEALADVGRQSRPLVVLDNCEHVADAARDIAAALLAGGCSVIATSRQPLGISGERLIPLTGLDDADAVALFLDVANRAGSSADLEDEVDDITQLCRRLDGLPLAIELAAARSRALSVPEILARLGARFRLLSGGGPARRHRTLYEAIQWSFDLLEPTEQQLFTHLSVFRGGCDLAAATRVAGAAGTDELDILDTLDALVARSVVVADVRATPTRYDTLETLREFAAQQLTEPEATATAARHADHYLALAEWAADALLGTEPEPARHTFEREWDNLRAAVDWTTTAGDVDRAARLVIAVDTYGYGARRHELGEWCERVLRTPGIDQHPAWSALAVIMVNVRRDAGDLTGAEAFAAQAMARDEAEGRPRFRTLAAAFIMAWSHGCLHDAAALIAPLQESAAADYRQDAVPIANYLRVLTALMADTEDPVAAAEEAWERAHRSQRPKALALAALGLLAVDIKIGAGNRRKELFDDVRRWAAPVGDKVVTNNAALWMMDRRTDDPQVTLSYARHTLVAARDEGQWATMDVTLRRIVPALVSLRRPHTAATVLGGLATIESALYDHDLSPLEAAEHTLRAELGADIERHRRRGQAMSKAELVALVLAETDAILATTTPEPP